MTTFRLRVRYDGTDFHGWQVQPGVRTVQGEIERALATILDGPVRIAGAGRTDRGVHASGQIASFTTERTIEPVRLSRGLRGLLPRDVVVSAVERAPEGFHARWSAVARTYRYHLTRRDTPITRRYAWVRSRLPDAARMAAAAAPLAGRHRFDAFTVSEALAADTTCTVQALTWTEHRGGLRLEIRADRFLYRMVRLVVGALVAMDREGRLDAGVVRDVLAAGRFEKRPAAAPSRGLFFARADYPHDGEIVPVAIEKPDVE